MLAVNHILKGECLLKRKICSLCLIHTKIKFIVLIRRTRLSTGITANTFVIYIPWIQLYCYIKITFFALDILDLCKGIKRDSGIVFYSLKLYLEAAVRRAEFPEVFVNLCHSPPKIGILFKAIKKTREG